MGKVNISAIGLVALIVLLVQIGLHTQLLQRKSATSKLSDGSISQYEEHSSSPAALIESSSTSLSRIRSNVQNKQLFQQPAITSFQNDIDGTTASTHHTNKLEASNIVITDTEPPPTINGEVVDPWEGVSEDLKIKRFYTGSFVDPNIHLCGSKKPNLTLVVVVPSAIHHFRKRNSVRKTWGSFTLRRDVVIGFMVGNPKLSQTNDTLLESFQRESDLFGDIIIADMKDSYQNLTLKVLHMLEWTSRYCSTARFFMKTDDDVFLNVPNVLDYISKINESDEREPKIYGNVFAGHMPQRSTASKQYVKYDVYPHDIKYPPFTSGPSYLVSSRILRPLLQQAVQLPLFNLEDVFLTGFVASTLNIPRVYVLPFRNELENPFHMSPCRLIQIIAGVTDGSPTQLYHVWYNYLMGRFLCKYLKLRSQ